ncbi:MAG: hypothetical protein R3B67_13665 [Phycisphaerales bacterium]
MRPCIVWFGEMLPGKPSNASTRPDVTCSSRSARALTVEPAASFILAAKENEAAAIEVVRDPTPNTGIVDVACRVRQAASCR